MISMPTFSRNKRKLKRRLLQYRMILHRLLQMVDEVRFLIEQDEGKLKGNKDGF